jgi:hypothetical protein
VDAWRSWRDSIVDLYIFVEGGSNHRALRMACRQGFKQFLEKANLKGHLPRIVASGARKNAYDDFCVALQQGKSAMLLVDSEDPVTNESPWDHLWQRVDDQWRRPAGSTDGQCHLMVQCMETWLLADREGLRVFFGRGYDAAALPDIAISIETISKSSVYLALKNATKSCKTKRCYAKGEHSFQLLGAIDPHRVISASKWAKRFVDAVKNEKGSERD